MDNSSDQIPPDAALVPPTFETPAAPRALAAGVCIGRYEIVRVIADTSMSVVYLAVDTADASEHVLKEYLPQQLTRREGLAVRPRTPADGAPLARGLGAFIAEAKLLAPFAFPEPTLVQVTALIEANGTAYQVMPQRGGARLMSVRQEMRVPPDETALRVLLDGLLDALEGLHARGINHGAVAPGNILLLADGRPLLLGPKRARAEIASSLVESLMASVEPSFAAPELHRTSASQPIGPWSDLYSVGETLRYCISGEVPPPLASPLGAGPREDMAAMLKRRYGHLPSVRYSTRLLAALDAVLDPSTGARPQNVAEFREALGSMPALSHADAWVGSAPMPLAQPPVASPAASPVAAPRAPSPSPTVPGRPAAPPAPVAAVVGAAGGRVEPAFDARQGARSRPAALPPTTRAARRPSRWPWWIAGSVGVLVIAALVGWWIRSTPIPPAPANAAAKTGPAATPAVESAVVAAPASAPASAPVSDPVATVAPAPAPAPVVTPVPIAAPPVEPAVTPPPAPAVRAASAAEHVRYASPRDACAGKTQFALYRCMQALCGQRAWTNHAQCERLRATDSVD